MQINSTANQIPSYLYPLRGIPAAVHVSGKIMCGAGMSLLTDMVPLISGAWQKTTV